MSAVAAASQLKYNVRRSRLSPVLLSVLFRFGPNCQCRARKPGHWHVAAWKVGRSVSLSVMMGAFGIRPKSPAEPARIIIVPPAVRQLRPRPRPP